jgi:GxxExxY protein
VHEGHEEGHFVSIVSFVVNKTFVLIVEENLVDILFKDEVYAIVGAAMEVHQELGPGFLEPVYQEALEIELQARNIPFESRKPLIIHYKGRELRKEYIPDFICYEQILVELKAMKHLSSQEEAQLLNYLKAANYKVGLLINFGSYGKLEWKRFVR